MNEKEFERHSGEVIRRYREIKGITQEELGREVGKSRHAIMKLENGETRLSANMAFEISDVLEFDVRELRITPSRQFDSYNVKRSLDAIRGELDRIQSITKPRY